MNTQLLLAYTYLPPDLVSASMLFIHYRIPRGRFESGEMRKRLLLGVLHMASQLGIRPSEAARKVLEEWVSLLMQLYGHLAKPTNKASKDGIATTAFLLSPSKDIKEAPG